VDLFPRNPLFPPSDPAPRLFQGPARKAISCQLDVRIPWIDDGKSYWLVLASSKLSDDDLEFRDVFKGAVLNGAGMPSHILAFSPLAQQVKWKGGPSEKKPGFIEFTLHKSQVSKAYIYHDFWNPMILDGGFYYTVKLGEYPVEQGGADQPATAVESKPEGSEKPKPESKVRSQ
jgi:hypothetical protein